MEKCEERDRGFTIQNSSTSFASKSQDIFGSLDALESKHEAFESSRKDDSFTRGWKSDPSSEDTQTILPAFKRPQGLPTRSRDHRKRSGWSDRDRGVSRGTHDGQRELDRGRGLDKGKSWDTWKGRGAKRRFQTPDYKLHPEKYTKYSLEDVSSEDMSNASNTKAALAFLEERRKLREGEMKEDAVDTSANACSKGVFVFARKSTNISKDSSCRPLIKKDKIPHKVEISCDEVTDRGSVVRNDISSYPCDNTKFTASDQAVQESDVREEKTSFKSRKKIGSRNIRRKEDTNSDED